MMCCSQIWDIVATLASALFSFCLVFFACRQTRIQKDNYKLSLLKEHCRTVEPIFSAYSYFEGGVDKFIGAFVFESKESQTPERGYELKKDLQNSSDSFLALFYDKKKEFGHFLEDYGSLLGKARVMCQNISKRQSGNDPTDLHTFISERSDSASIRQAELVKVFPSVKKYIDDFCATQAVYIGRYSAFVNYLKDKVVMD